MKRETIKVKTDQSRRRASFLFNDGEFKPRQERSAKAFRRQPKHRPAAGTFSAE